MLSEIQGIMGIQSRGKNINLEFVTKEEVPTDIYTDMKRLKQVLFNLISNSLKFTPSNGSIKVRFVLVSKQRGKVEDDQQFEGEEVRKSKIMVKVEDTGIGIKPEDMAKLFNLFGTLKDSENINQNGIGLGLVICKKITE
jgi:signal transduction histidine kinase